MIGINMTREEWKQADRLPYYLIDAYKFQAARIDGICCLILRPSGDLGNISAIRKHLAHLREICEWPVVFELPSLSRQRRAALIEARIAFVVTGKQVYLPFIGIQLQERSDRESMVAPVLSKLQPSAQMLLFAFILGMNKPVHLSEMTRRFGLSAMSLSRAADQLAQLSLIRKRREGVHLLLSAEITPGDLYQKAKPYLINPVRKTIYIMKSEITPEMFPAGLSALADRSLLQFPALEVRGTAKSGKLFAGAVKQLIDEEKQCALELWKYDPRLICGDDRIDALSLAESLKNNTDERVEQMLEDLLAEVW